MARLEFEVDIAKAYVGEGETSHVVAVVSDSLIDSQGDRVSKEALEMMALDLSKGEIPLLDSHKGTFDLGISKQGGVEIENGNPTLVADFELDMDFVESRKLFKEVGSGNAKKQLSIGAYIPKVHDAVLFETNKNGEVVRILNRLEIDHVALTRKSRAANDRTKFRSAVKKALDDAESESQAEQITLKLENNKMVDTENKEAPTAKTQEVAFDLSAALTSIKQVAKEADQGLMKDFISELVGIVGYDKFTPPVKEEVNETNPPVAVAENVDAREKFLAGAEQFLSAAKEVNTLSTEVTSALSKTAEIIKAAVEEAISKLVVPALETIKSDFSKSVEGLEARLGKVEEIEGASSASADINKEMDQGDNCFTGLFDGAKRVASAKYKD